MAQQALTSPDILVLVFGLLPQQHLLLAQRVCRQWHAVITSTAELQQLLFLQPSFERRPGQMVQINPLLYEHFPIFFLHGRPYECRPDERRLQHKPFGPWYLTHYMGKTPPWPDTHTQAAYAPSGASPLRAMPSRARDPSRYAAYERPQASWRRMLPCLPPPEELQIAHEGTLWHQPGQPTEGHLFCLRFQDHTERARDQETKPATGSGCPPCPPWLTFGRLYDIVQAAWFDDSCPPTRSVQFDWSFEDQARPFSRTNRWFRAREGLRAALSPKKVGGEACLLIVFKYHWDGHEQWGSTTAFAPGYTCRENDNAKDVAWDEEHRYLRQ